VIRALPTYRAPRPGARGLGRPIVSRVDCAPERMDASQVEQRTRVEWPTGENAPNPHGLTLDRNLVTPPRRKLFRNSFFQPEASEPWRRKEILDLWVVVDECVDLGDGYLIVFDEERLEYGLAVEPDLFLNYCRSLAETIAGM
jgi:hypothetical protein